MQHPIQTHMRHPMRKGDRDCGRVFGCVFAIIASCAMWWAAVSFIRWMFT